MQAPFPYLGSQFLSPAHWTPAVQLTPITYYSPLPNARSIPVFTPVVSPITMPSQQISATCSPSHIVHSVETRHHTPYASPNNAFPNSSPQAGAIPVWPPEQLAPLTPWTPAPCYLPRPAPDVFEAGAFPAQPLGSDIPIRLHPHIIINPINPSVPVLQWDVIQAAELARVVSGRNCLLPVTLGASAVSPGARKMYITSDAPYLEFWMKQWGPIMVRKVDKDITIRDVLDAIHDYFQQPLMERDLKRLKVHPENVDTLRLAEAARIRDSYDALPPVTAMMGYRRSDALGRMRKFQGLRVVVFADGTWKVYLGLASGPVPRITA